MGSSADGATTIWFDPSTNSLRTYVGSAMVGVQQTTSPGANGAPNGGGGTIQVGSGTSAKVVTPPTHGDGMTTQDMSMTGDKVTVGTPTSPSAITEANTNTLTQTSDPYTNPTPPPPDFPVSQPTSFGGPATSIDQGISQTPEQASFTPNFIAPTPEQPSGGFTQVPFSSPAKTQGGNLASPTSSTSPFASIPGAGPVNSTVLDPAVAERIRQAQAFQNAGGSMLSNTDARQSTAQYSTNPFNQAASQTPVTQAAPSSNPFTPVQGVATPAAWNPQGASLDPGLVDNTPSPDTWPMPIDNIYGPYFTQ